MRWIRVSSLQVAAAALSCFLGALMLVAPHQFSFLGGVSLEPGFITWGFAFLVAGICLFSRLVLRMPAWLMVGIHLLTCGLLAALGFSLGLAGSWVAMLQYVLLGLGVGVAAFIPPPSTSNQDPVVDLLSLLAGVAALLAGVAWLAGYRWQMENPLYLLNPWEKVVFGLALILAGGLLTAGQVLAWRLGLPATGPRAPRWLSALNWAGHLLTGGLFLAFIIFGTLLQRLWVAGAYYAGIGLGIAVLPWLGLRLQHTHRRSLYSRLALILGVAAGLPLILTVAMIGQGQEQSVRAEALANAESQAAARAQGVADGVALYGSALKALSDSPGLMTLPAEEQRQVLESFARAYPSAAAFGLYDPAGQLLARAGAQTLPRSLAGSPNFEAVRRTIQPAVEFERSQSGQAILFSAPLAGPEGEFAGLAALELPAGKLSIYLEAGGSQGISPASIYLVDAAGRALVPLAPDPGDHFRDLSGSPAVQELLSGKSDTDSLEFYTDSGEWLAGYARIPALGWGVVVERPAAEALAGVYAGRSLGFGVLLATLLLTTAGGLYLAGHLVHPLQSLGLAAHHLAAGQGRAPLPHSGFTELDQLASAFRSMRDQLEERTAHREAAEADLRAARAALLEANEELERRVAARTTELESAHRDLEWELAERERAEEALRVSESRFRVALAHAGITVFSQDRDLRYTWSYNLPGLYSGPPVLGRSDSELLAPHEAARLTEIKRRVLETGQGARGEVTLRLGDQLAYYDLIVEPLLNAEGEIGGVLGSAADITAYRQAEREIRRQRELLERLVMNAPIGIALVAGPDLRYELANPSYESIPGLARRPVTGLTTGEAFPSAAWAGLDRDMRATLETGQALRRRELLYEPELGAARTWWNVEQIPLPDVDGRVDRLFLMTQEVTETVLARQALERERALLQAVIDNAPGGIVVVDAQARVLLTNAAAGRLYAPIPTGQPYGIIDGLQVLRPDGTPYDRRDLPLTRAALDGDAFVNVEMHVVRPDGQGRPLLVNTAPIRSPQGEITGAVGVFQDISHLKLTEQQLREALAALKESEQRYKIMGETLPYGVWLADPSGQIVYTSQSYLDLLGISTRELGDFGWARRLPPEDQQPVLERWMACFRSGEDWESELRFPSPDGSYHTVLSRGKPVHDEAGRITCWVGIHLDIDERKHLEERLAYHALLFENVHDAVVATDTDFRLTAWNRAAESLYGWKASEVLGRSLSEVIHQEGSPEWSQDAWLRLESEAYFTDEIVQYTRSGEPVSVDATCAALRDDQGRVIGYLNAYRDLTARNLAQAEREKALAERREGERRLNTALESMPVGVWLTDSTGKIIYGNPAGQQIWAGAQYVGPPELGVYKAWWAGTGQPILPEEWAVARAVRNRETSLNEVLEIEDFDGSRKVILNSAVPILDEAGELLGVVVVNEDITEQRQAEQALQSYAAQLERSNRDLEDFAFIASHDLQEPLRKVRSFGNLLRSDYSASLGEKGRDYVLRMQEAAGRMQSMIDDLLEYSRISTRAKPFVSLNLNDVVQEVVLDLEDLIERTGGRVEAGDLFHLQADRSQMRQLLQNLIGNALKFHRQDVPPVVKVWAQSAGEKEICVQIFVEDNGIGFEMEYLERIFQPFQRLHGRSQYEGSGIGLAICRKIAERHGGSITAHSHPGQGTTFVVTLPLKQEAAGHGAAQMAHTTR